MRIAVVTLLWRNELFAEPFVRTLADAAEQAATRVDLIALQNGPDGAEAAAALERAAAGSPGVALTLERSDHNLGFAGGMNAVCRSQAAALAEVTVVANLDLEFDRNFFEALRLQADRVAGLAFLAPSVELPRDPREGAGRTASGLEDSDVEDGDVEDGDVEDSDVEAGALRRDWLHRPSKGRSASLAGQRVPAGNGSCLVMGRALLEERSRAVGGLFDAEYHSYYEDVDLFWWAERAEIPVWFMPELRVRHHQGGSFGGKFRFGDRTPDVQASVMANYRITVWKNCRGPLDTIGWIVGEIGYVWLCVRRGPVGGLRTYLQSWRQARVRVAEIRRRRGSLRVRQVR